MSLPCSKSTTRQAAASTALSLICVWQALSSSSLDQKRYLIWVGGSTHHPKRHAPQTTTPPRAARYLGLDIAPGTESSRPFVTWLCPITGSSPLGAMLLDSPNQLVTTSELCGSASRRAGSEEGLRPTARWAMRSSIGHRHRCKISDQTALFE